MGGGRCYVPTGQTQKYHVCRRDPRSEDRAQRAQREAEAERKVIFLIIENFGD
jgi:hypothetical protein